MRDQLLQSIVKGAEYIESIGKDHPKYNAAMKRFYGLCDQVDKLKRMEREHEKEESRDTSDRVKEHMEIIRTLLAGATNKRR